MKSFSFLQFSDCHLDSDLSRSALQYPDAVAAQIREHQRETLTRVMREAVERKVEAIFIPGDLWDGEGVRQDTVFWLMELFESVSPIPVYIVPGNHDPFHQNSPYHSHYADLRGVSGWSSNVTIFRSERGESVIHPSRPDVCITGVATLAVATGFDRPLARCLDRPKRDGISILLFHGSREMEGIPNDKMLRAASFRDGELLAQGFSYVALGHYHKRIFVADSQGRVFGAYAGTPCGRTLSETGKKGVLFGTCTEEGVKVQDLEEVSFCPHVIHRIEVDVGRLMHKNAVIEKVEQAVQEVAPGNLDILYVVLSGIYGACEVPDIGAADFDLSVLHLVVDQQIRPGYDLSAYVREGGVETIERRLVKEMQRRISNAASDDERNVLEAALYYGLDALVQGRCDTVYARYFHG